MLRSETAADHRRVDAAFGGFDLAKRSGYHAFLSAQADAYIPVETGIDQFNCGWPLEDWPARRRAHLLLSDLRALGSDAEGAREVGDVPVFDSVESVLGATYVLEGSRLGGRVLARSIAAGMPQAFLGSGDSGQWRRLIEVLDVTLVTEVQLAAATDSARAVFARFESSAYRFRQVALA